jgi:hypothetical protein
MSEERRQQRTYDHRLRELVRETGDPAIATRLGVPVPPKNSVHGEIIEIRPWREQAPQPC